MGRQRQPEEPLPPGWQKCPPGELQRLGTQLRSRKRRRTFIRAGIAAAASLCLSGGVFWLLGPSRREEEYNFGGITCSEVLRSADDFMAGKLSEPVNQRIRIHLAECPMCKKLLDGKKGTPS